MTTSDGRAEASSANASANAAAEVPPAGRRRRWVRRWMLEAVVFAGLYLALTAFQERHLVDSGAPAPEFTLASLDGRSVSLDSLRGKRVLLHFWATWCGVCNMEFSALNAVARGLGPDEVLVSVVADSDDPEAIRHFAAEKHLDYPILLGTPETLRRFHVGAFPTNYFLDRNGVIRGHTVGMSNRFSLRARLALAR